VVEIDEFAVSGSYIVERSKIRSTLLYIMTTTRSGFLLTPIKMTLDDLECRIQLKVRFTDGTRCLSAVAELLVRTVLVCLDLTSTVSFYPVMLGLLMSVVTGIHFTSDAISVLLLSSTPHCI